MVSVILGAREAEHIELKFVVPPPSNRDGWLEAHVEIVVTGFRGSIRAFVETDDLVRLRDGLTKVYETLSGHAELKPRESQIVLTFEGNGRGGVSVTGTAYAHACYGNKLEFQIELDQTYLAEPLRTLNTIIEQQAVHGA